MDMSEQDLTRRLRDAKAIDAAKAIDDEPHLRDQRYIEIRDSVRRGMLEDILGELGRVETLMKAGEADVADLNRLVPLIAAFGGLFAPGWTARDEGPRSCD